MSAVALALTLVGCPAAPPAAPLPAPAAAPAPVPAPLAVTTDGGSYLLTVEVAAPGRVVLRVEPAAGPLHAAVVVDGAAWAVAVDGARITAVGGPAAPGTPVQIAVHGPAGPDRAAWTLPTAP